MLSCVESIINWRVATLYEGILGEGSGAKPELCKAGAEPSIVVVR